MKEADPPKRKTLNPEVIHGLTCDNAKHRYRLRIAIGRGKKLVSKRITIDLPTTQERMAIFARDGILMFCEKIGLTVIERPQRRPGSRKEGE